MASTDLGRTLTERYRADQINLSAAAVRDLVAVWPMFNIDDIDGSWPSVEAALLSVINRRRLQSSIAAAGYFRRFRLAEGASASVSPMLASAPDPLMTVATLRLLGPILTKKAIARRATAPADVALTRLAGSTSRQVMNAGRETLKQSLQRDPDVQGMRRITSGAPCQFCSDLAAVGIVGVDVDFPAHDHCSCTQEPVYAT